VARVGPAGANHARYGIPDCLALEIALLYAGCCPGRRRHDDLGRPGSGASKLTLPLSDPWVSEAGHHPRHALPSLPACRLIAVTRWSSNFAYDRDECIRRLRYYLPATSFRSTWAYSNLGFQRWRLRGSTGSGEVVG